MPVAPVGSRQQQISSIQQLIINRITPKYGSAEANQLAESYGKYADAHPKMPPKQAYLAWFLVESKIPNKLGKDLKLAIGSGGDLFKDTLKSLPSLDIFNGLNLGNILVRVGELLIGLVLIGVGVAKITGAENIASKLVKAKI